MYRLNLQKQKWSKQLPRAVTGGSMMELRCDCHWFLAGRGERQILWIFGQPPETVHMLFRAENSEIMAVVYFKEEMFGLPL